MRAMRIPLHRLWLLPLVSGVVWFVTLLSLLLRWVARGTPRYPGQSNPYVAFISDIAAFDMKPLFLIGACITAVAFIGTVCAVHFARYDDRMYGINDFWYKKWSSVLAMVSGVVAGLGLILLAIMDTFRFHEEHHVLLLVCFSGLAMSSLSTTLVYFDQTKKPSPFRLLRLYCSASAAIVAIEVILGVAFTALMYMSYWRTAGVLEWTMAFIGCFYMLAFVGFVAVPPEGIDARERDPLLQEPAGSSV
ncbi:Frag1/DRAM/Sfk1 [Phyllosticta capitalensis]|uniref:Frag1/DRAM/Sfk1 n=1 Tax=Phyllosticta capitalensis TaxID=121624 RepID=A0ABR1YEW5_9PEZI